LLKPCSCLGQKGRLKRAKYDIDLIPLELAEPSNTAELDLLQASDAAPVEVGRASE